MKTQAYARQAIRTRYAGPTDTRPGRIVATHCGKAARVVLSYDHTLNGVDNHRQAAQALADRLGWGAVDPVALAYSDAYYWRTA